MASASLVTTHLCLLHHCLHAASVGQWSTSEVRQHELELHGELAFSLAAFGTHLSHAQAGLSEMHTLPTDSANG